MRKSFLAAAFLCLVKLAAAEQSTAPPDVVKDIAPTGKLRAAFNLVNTVIGHFNSANGEPEGVSADLSRELARRLGVPVEFVIFNGAGKEFDAAGSGKWDVGYFGIDPEREAHVDYTAPYVLIEGGYLVLKESPVKTTEDADKEGTRIAVGSESVYDIYLTRELKHATLVRVTPASLENVVDNFMKNKLDVAAFIKIPLIEYAKDKPQFRIVHGSFMDIWQAMATPKGRDQAVLNYLRAFIEDVKASGFVADSLKRSGETSASVAPPAKK